MQTFFNNFTVILLCKALQAYTRDAYYQQIDTKLNIFVELTGFMESKMSLK